MKTTTTMRRVITTLLALFISSACGQLWTDLDNPVDDRAANYQGYETVTDPSKIGPADTDAGVVTYAPVLVSTKVVGAEAYQFQISATVGFASPIYTSPETVSNKFLPTDCPGLSAATTYYWRVRAKTGGDWSDYTSTLATFSLSAPAAGDVAPVDASTTADTSPVLDWNDIAGATGYQVQLADSSADVATAAAVAAPASQYHVPTGFALGTWHWRIRAKNADNVWGAWSATWSFTTSWPYVLTPTPADAGTTSDTTPLLDWNDVTGAIGYEIQVAGPSTPIQGVSAVSTTVSEYQQQIVWALGDVWHWRVRAKNADEVWGAWSSTWSFTISWTYAPTPTPADDRHDPFARLERHSRSRRLSSAAGGFQQRRRGGDGTECG
jgi:hypothetical protein